MHLHGCFFMDACAEHKVQIINVCNFQSPLYVLEGHKKPIVSLQTISIVSLLMYNHIKLWDVNTARSYV